MGNPDPEIARQETPNSLRALYGISREQNGIMGSVDAQQAEIQILSIFASSPPCLLSYLLFSWLSLTFLPFSPFPSLLFSFLSFTSLDPF